MSTQRRDAADLRRESALLRRTARTQARLASDRHRAYGETIRRSRDLCRRPLVSAWSTLRWRAPRNELEDVLELLP